MRNLKRALSLALASIMVLGMMVVGAGAVSIDDFSDGEKIVNTEAVATMVSLGVINGKDDGSYDPEGIVTRAEMAKLISVMLNGGKDPTLGSITAQFTDTAGHWAENYIAYVANLKIVDGRGDGTFGPNDPVTGAQAAKMLLTALGYRSEIEGFTGATWAVNVQLKGNDIQLFEDLSINPDEGLSRDNTAQMIYNAVQAQEVEYRNLDGNYNDVIYPTDKGTMLSNRFHVVKVEGVVEANDTFSVNGNPAPAGKTRLTLTNSRYLKADGTYSDTYAGAYTLTVGNDMVGKRIVIYVKFLNDLAPNASGSTVIGTPILSDKNTIVETTGKLKNADKVKDALKGSGIKVVTDTVGIVVTEAGTTRDNKTGIWNLPGVKQTFIDHDDDGDVDFIIQEKLALAKVTVYNTKDEKLTLTGTDLGSIDFDDIANFDDVAKDDYVLVGKYDDTYYLTKAETVSGEVTKFDSSNNKITIDGTTYAVGAGKNLAPDLEDAFLAELAADFDMNGSGKDKTPNTNDNLRDLVEGTYTLYLDQAGNFLAYVEDEAAVGNYAVITGSDASGSYGFRTGKVKLLMADGTTGNYDVDLLSSAKKWSAGVNTGNDTAKENNMADVLDGNLAAGTLVTYTLNGSTVTLARPGYSNVKYAMPSADTDISLKNSRSSYTFGGVTMMADNSTAIFVKDVEGNYSAISGLSKVRADAVTTTKASAITYTRQGGVTTAKALYVETTERYAASVDYVYIISTFTKVNESGTVLYQYPVVHEDGTVGYLKSKTDDSLEDGTVYSYTVGSDGYAEFGSSKEVNGQVVTGTGSNAVAVTSAKNPGTTSASYPVPTTAKVWNVVDADVDDAGTVWSTKMAITDKVALALDDDGNVRTAFVYDTVDTSTMVGRPSAGSLTASGSFASDDEGTAADAAWQKNFAENGGTIYWNSANGELKLNVTLPTVGTTLSTAKFTVSVDGGKATDPKNFTSGSANEVYKSNGKDVNTKVKVSLVISDANTTKKLDSRTITYTFIVNSADTAVPAATVAVVDDFVKTGVTPGEISPVADVDDTYALTDGVQGQTVTLSFANLGGATAKITNVVADPTLVAANVVKPSTTALTAGTPVNIYSIKNKDASEAGKIEVTVTFSKSGSRDIDVVYTFEIGHRDIYSVSTVGAGIAEYYKGEKIDLSGLAGKYAKIDDAAPVENSTLTAYEVTKDIVVDAGYYKATVSTTVTNLTVGSVTASEFVKAAGGTVTADLTGSALTGSITGATVSIASGATAGTATVTDSNASGTISVPVSNVTDNFTISITAIS